jgi:hypothetical protein
MRYMLLVYTKENETRQSPENTQEMMAGHWAVIDETTKRGIFRAAEPLQPTQSATTVRVQNGKLLIIDGPFAETKEQLAGYYILDCQDLNEAITWATKIPTGCGGAAGCIEIRALRELPLRPSPSKRDPEYAGALNG